jgi:hypothetical protein
MATKQLMTAQEFDNQKHKLRTLSVQTNDLARLVLVEGLNNTQAAAAVGMSRQNVNGAMNRVRALLSDMPADWVYFQEWMPAAMAAEIRAKIKSLSSLKVSAENIAKQALTDARSKG